MTANSTIRQEAKDARVKHWEIALHLGVSEQTLVRWLRTPLDVTKEQQIRCAINELATERAKVS